jgi:hypothetical protein
MCDYWEMNMKTETLELTGVELDYLRSVLVAYVNSGQAWGDTEQVLKIQDGVFGKIEDALRILDKEYAQHGMD